MFVFLDDKHRCRVVEPSYPVAAVERSKQVVVSTRGRKFAAADHDFTKFAVIPSVTVLFDIPVYRLIILQGISFLLALKLPR